MDRVEWEAHRDAPEGPRKRKMLAKLLVDNEALARYYVRGFASASSYYTENMYDDLLQAARIGIIRALERWDPDKGGFSSVAFRWALHEMQSVTENATAMKIPRRAFLLRREQEKIAVFKALHGRDPAPEEVGLTPAAVERARQADVEMVPVSDADNVAAPDAEDGPEATIDRKRDQESLQRYLATLSKRDVREFWTGTRADLTAAAKAYVEEARDDYSGR